MAVVGRLASDGWMDGEKVIKSLCQYSAVPSLALTTHSGRTQESSLGSSRDTDHNVDRWPTMSVCAKGRGGRFGQIFSLPFFTGKRGVAVAE